MREVFDVIIVGTGIAGLTGAIYLKESGLNVVLITKSDKIEETNTNYAQGGIIAYKEGDNPSKLAEDIYKAGCYYNNKEAVKTLSEEGPKLVFDFLINKIEMDFNKNKDGNYDYTEEAAHSERRILHYQDQQNGLLLVVLYHASDCLRLFLFDKKWFARLVISEVIVQTMETLNLAYPRLTTEQLEALEDCKLQLMNEA